MLRERRVGVAEELPLDLGVLDHRLDQQICFGELTDRGDARKGLGRIGAALLGELREAPLHRLERPVGRTRKWVEERDSPSRRGDDLRDPAAHLAGADDEDVLELHQAISRRIVRGTSRGTSSLDSAVAAAACCKEEAASSSPSRS